MRDEKKHKGRTEMASGIDQLMVDLIVANKASMVRVEYFLENNSKG